jgi:hypothetical protein
LAGVTIDGHSPFGATGHPHAIGSTFILEMILFGSIFAAIGLIIGLYLKKKVFKQAESKRIKQ